MRPCPVGAGAFLLVPHMEMASDKPEWYRAIAPLSDVNQMEVLFYGKQ